MPSRPRLAMTAALAVSALALSACGLSPQEDDTSDDAAPAGDDDGTSGAPAELSGSIDFQTWSLKNETFTPYFEQLITDFEAENPGTEITWVDQPGEGYQEKILQQVQTGDLPDVVNLPPDFAYQLSDFGALRDLEAADAAILDVYTPGGVDAYRYDGVEGVYGYPWYLGTDLSWWNTDLMAEGGVTEIPTDFESMRDAALTMAENGGEPLFSSAPGIGDLAANGIPILEGGEFVFNTPEAAEILQGYVDLYAAGAMPPEALSNDYAGNTTLYQQGAVAFTTATATFAGELETNAPTLVEGTQATPRIGTPPLFVQGVSVAQESDNPDLALAFAQYVTDNENQVEFVKVASGFLPGTAEANENPDSFASAIEDPLVQDAMAIAAEQMPDAQTQMPVQWTAEMNTYAQQQIPLALRGDITPQEALDGIVEQANTLLVD